jgi:hypothetical protein
MALTGTDPSESPLHSIDLRRAHVRSSETPFTPPWDIEDNGACFIVRDANRQALRYVCYENEPGHEARRIAINIAKLPGCYVTARHCGK